MAELKSSRLLACRVTNRLCRLGLDVELYAVDADDHDFVLTVGGVTRVYIGRKPADPTIYDFIAGWWVVELCFYKKAGRERWEVPGSYSDWLVRMVSIHQAGGHAPLSTTPTTGGTGLAA